MVATDLDDPAVAIDPDYPVVAIDLDYPVVVIDPDCPVVAIDPDYPVVVIGLDGPAMVTDLDGPAMVTDPDGPAMVTDLDGPDALGLATDPTGLARGPVPRVLDGRDDQDTLGVLVHRSTAVRIDGGTTARIARLDPVFGTVVDTIRTGTRGITGGTVIVPITGGVVARPWR